MRSSMLFGVLVAVCVFSPFTVAEAEGSSLDISSGEIYTVRERRACAYHGEDGKEEYYLCLYLDPQPGATTPNMWQAQMCKIGREQELLGVASFDNDLFWRVMSHTTPMTDNVVADAGSYCSTTSVDLSTIACGDYAYLRAVVTSPLGCSGGDCARDTGAIEVNRQCGSLQNH